MEAPDRTPVRTLLVSDLHLGSKYARGEEFLRFLRSYHPETLYLVGDIIDGWKINSGWHWPECCDQIVDELVGLAESGTKIFYVPGNHDAFLRNPVIKSFLSTDFPQFHVANEFVFESRAGYRLLVTHGDLFDVFEMRAQWVSRALTIVYDRCLSLNWYFNRIVFRGRRNPYGACASLKGKVKQGARFLSRFEHSILEYASDRSCHGVVCGHIHTPCISESDSMFYLNTGDWVENCTGLVESHDGTLNLVSRYGQDLRLNLPERALTSRTVRADQPSDLSDIEPVPA